MELLHKLIKLTDDTNLTIFLQINF